MAEQLIEAKGLSKHFTVSGGRFRSRRPGTVRALDGVSFTIGQGETLALVGESGCGKTTAARVLLRLKKPTEGTVSLDGRDIHQLSGQDLKWFRKSVQAVFQDPWASLSPRMRIRDIVAEPLQVNEKLPKKEMRERVGALLVRVGLQPWQANLFPHEFSGGQRQRVALASALITEPRLIVLDEPVSALDVSVQAQVMNLLKDIQRNLGTAYLLITHDLATVRFVAHRVVVMYLGQVVEEASTTDLLDNPKHPYTQALLNSALPQHPSNRRPRLDLVGEIPSPLDPPTGCRFRTRCPMAMDVCRETPPVTVLEPGHSVSCHLY